MRPSSLLLALALLSPTAAQAQDADAQARRAAVQALVPLPPQPDIVSWPTRGWTTAEPLDLDGVLGTDFDTPDALIGQTRALVVVRGGRIVFERYADGTTRNTRHVSWSMAKSVTHALVGRAVRLGLIDDIDAPMPGAFSGDDPRGRISWRHWLQMLDGLDYAEIGVEGLGNDVVQMMYGPGRFDVVEHARSEFKADHAPGTHWNYSTAGYHLISRALQSLIPGICVSAGKDPRTCRANPRITSDWLDREFFAPLGLDAVEEYDHAGTLLGGSLIYMSARDFAKFGLLYLRGGMWEDERFLPDGWVDFARTNPPGSDSNLYGAGFWLTPENPTNPDTVMGPPHDAFHAGGHEGQTIWIVPSRDAVIVRLGLMPNGPEAWNGLFALNQAVVAALD